MRVYGPPYTKEHQSFWDSMLDSTIRVGKPWALVGDLNQIVSVGEKFGGRAVTWNTWDLTEFYG